MPDWIEINRGWNEDRVIGRVKRFVRVKQPVEHRIASQISVEFIRIEVHVDQVGPLLEPAGLDGRRPRVLRDQRHPRIKRAAGNDDGIS